MKKDKIILVVLVLIFTFLMVYSPHIGYKYPFHIDEWRHITESKRLAQGELPEGPLIFELGFDVFLLLISKLSFDLVLAYKFFPALFACISSLMLFFLMNKTAKKFYIALFSMIFFASLKSNVNIMGLWFFSPMTFAIPLIYLFFWLFSEAVEKNKIKLFYWSFFVYFIILVSHPISATFMIPILIIYLIIKKKFVIKNYKALLIFLAAPILLFAITFKFLWRGSLVKTITLLSNYIVFKYGWGVLELDYNIIIFYGILSFLLAIFGAYFAYRKKQYIFIIWPSTLLILILLFNILKFSILVPYQRLLYYTMLGLVPLSAIGLYYVSILLKNTLMKLKINFKEKRLLINIIVACVVFIFIFAAFHNYFYLEKQVELYKVIDDNSYEAIRFLRNYPKSLVLAPVHTSTAIPAISGHDIIATLYFYNLNNRKIVEDAYSSGNCSKIIELAQQKNATFILNDVSMETCGLDEVYNKGYYIYKVQ